MLFLFGTLPRGSNCNSKGLLLTSKHLEESILDVHLWKTAEKLNWRTSNLKRNGIKYSHYLLSTNQVASAFGEVPQDSCPVGYFSRVLGVLESHFQEPAAAGARLMCPVVGLCFQWGIAELPHPGHDAPLKVQLSCASEAEFTQITGFSTIVQLLARNEKENQLCYHSCICRERSGGRGFCDLVTSILLLNSNS